MNFGFKSKQHPAQINEMESFEKYLLAIKFKYERQSPGKDGKQYFKNKIVLIYTILLSF